MSNDGIFILTEYENTQSTTELYVFDSLQELNDYLAVESINVSNMDTYKVYHGVSVLANFIPDNLSGCTPYIVIRNPKGKTVKSLENECHFEKAKGGVVELVKRIEELLKEEKYEFHSDDPPAIEDVRLFFGQEVKLALTVADDTIDEEVIERVSALSKEFNHHNERIKDGTYETAS